jgi:hypothetical protein
MNLFWRFYHIVVLSIATIFCVERPRYWREERFAAEEEAWVRASGCEFILARLEDLSLGGCRICSLVDGAAGAGASVGVWIKGVGALRVTCVVADANGPLLAFLAEPAAKAALVRRVFGGGMVRPIETRRPGDFAATALRRALG